MDINTNVTSSETALELKQKAFKQTAADLRNEPDLTVLELIKYYKKHYRDICDEAGVQPEQQYIKKFRYEMKYLKKKFNQIKAYGYTEEQRKRSLETRQEARWAIIEKIIELKEERFTHKQIAEYIGIHVKTISRYLREINYKKK
jgi:uncharacterized protein YerC